MHKLLLKLRLKIYTLLIISYLAVGLLSTVVFSVLLPENYFRAYPAIGIFYLVTGLLLNMSLDRTRWQRPDKLLNIYMMGRMVKFVLTIVFLLVGGGLISSVPERKTFAISLVCNYFVYTGLELYIYYQYNKRITRNANKK